jgi:GNAT superfamily N-acetyltransferase
MEVRPARRDELRAADEARIATWRTAYRGIVPDPVLDTLELTEEKLSWLEQRFDDGLVSTLVAVEGSDVVGMAARGPCQDEDRYGEDELFAVYLLPTWWGSGAGQALWEAAWPFTSLWVLADNARARRFYERNGFVADRTATVDLGVPLVKVRYLLA